MTFVRTIRCLRASLLALFVLSQGVGVVPLIYDHTLNVYEAMPVAAHGHAHFRPTVASPDADPRHGALDLHDQCCPLHTLAGPLPHVIDAAPVSFSIVRLLPLAALALHRAHPR